MLMNTASFNQDHGSQQDHIRNVGSQWVGKIEVAMYKQDHNRPARSFDKQYQQCISSSVADWPDHILMIIFADAPVTSG